MGFCYPTTLDPTTTPSFGTIKTKYPPDPTNYIYTLPPFHAVDLSCGRHSPLQMRCGPHRFLARARKMKSFYEGVGSHGEGVM
eukprot:759920-Hanusia_phi.AAC.1